TGGPPIGFTDTWVPETGLSRTTGCGRHGAAEAAQATAALCRLADFRFPTAVGTETAPGRMWPPRIVSDASEALRGTGNVDHCTLSATKCWQQATDFSILQPCT